MHAFSAAYPYILATMYNTKIDKKIKIQCPGKEHCVTLILKKSYKIRSNFIRSILDLFKKLFGVFFYPTELLDYNLEIDVLESELSESLLEKGKKYTVNLRNKDFLCPASFHVLYPYLLLNVLDFKMMWNRIDAINLLPCPDCVGTTYSINSTREYR